MKSSIRRKASARALESREHESLNWKKAFSNAKDQQEWQEYYEYMHQDN